MPLRLPALLLALASLLLATPCRALQLDEALNTELLALAATDTERVAITDYLRANLGEPYRLGATGGSEGFDCSGLVLRAYAAAGLAVPRASRDQLRSGADVPLSDLRAGDLLFYRMQSGAPQGLHVAVYVGEGRAIHASITHQEVREIDITRKVWASRLVAARGLL